MPITIPKGKEIKIYANGVSVLDDPEIASGVKLKQEEDIIINVSSSFQTLFSGGGNKIIDVVGSVARDLGLGQGFSSQRKEFGFQIWEKSEPAVMNFTFSFYRGMADLFDGRSEVENPIKKLTQLPLPSDSGGALGFLIPPGPSILNLLDSGERGNTLGTVLSVQIGEFIRFRNVIITRAEPTISIEKDTNGYSITGKVQLEIKTLFNATKELFPLATANFQKSFQEYLEEPEEA